MEKQAFAYLQKSEESWWWKGRSYVVTRLLSRFARTGAVLDAGAGFGSMHDILASYGQVTALETNAGAIDVLETRGYAKVVRDIEAADTYDLIGAFDVIEHIEDDKAFAGKLFSSLKSGGVLVATVPAYQFLWSVHDVEHHHFRRYTKGQMEKLLTNAGFELQCASYWNCTLLPVAYLLRKLGSGGGESLMPHPFVNGALSLLLWLESRVMPYLSLPWGISVVVVAKKI